MFRKFLKGPGLPILGVILACLAYLISFLAPSDLKEMDDEGIIEITFADNISPAHQRVIDAFNQAHDGRIRVVALDLPFEKFSTNERKQLLARSFRSEGGSVDVFAADLFWIPRFAKWCEPLEGYFSEAERSHFLRYALETCSFDGELVGVPLYIDVGILYYRRDLLQTLPDFHEVEEKLKRSITWDEFITLHERLKDTKQPFYVFPADNYEGLMCSFVEMLASQNQPLFANGVVQLTSAEAIRAVNLLDDLVNRFEMTPPVVTEFREVDSYQYALENDALFFRGWPGNLTTYEEDEQYRAVIDQIDVAALPHFEGHEPVAVLGGWNLMVSTSSDNKEAAVKFLKFATSPEMQKILYETGGYLPANNLVYADSSYGAQHPELAYYRELLKLGVHRPARAEYTKISDIISYYIKLIIKNEMSPREGLQRALDRIRSEKTSIN